MSTKMVKSCDLCAAVIEETESAKSSIEITVGAQHPMAVPADSAAHFPNHTAYYRRDVCLVCAPPLLKILGMFLYQEGSLENGVEGFRKTYETR